MRNNVTTEDIREIESRLGMELTQEQREDILKRFNRLVMDRAEDWQDLIQDIINGKEKR